MKKLLYFVFILSVLAIGNILYAQTSKQAIGQYPSMDGGMEGQGTGALTSVTFGGTTTRADWTVSTNGVGNWKTTSPRTGAKYVNMYTNSTTKRLHTPSAQADTIVAARLYTVQFYYRTANTTTPGTNMQIGVSANGTNGAGSYRLISMPATNGVWTKFADTVRCNANAVASPVYGIGIVRCSTAMVEANGYDIDDFVVYEGATDNSAPNSITGLDTSATSSASISLSWSEPSGGIDLGGYMVIRYGSDPTGQPDPNANGIYAAESTLGTGTIVYIGKNRSCTDGGLSALTTYYYRVYSIDKAFNYSSAVSGSFTTRQISLAAQPTIQASNITFSNIAQTSFDITWTNGDGTNRLVLIKSGTAVNSNPIDAVSYAANTVFTGGSQIGTGNYVVYNGTSNTVSVTGLTKATKYYVSVFEFNGSSGSENYLTTSVPSANQTTNTATISTNGTGGGDWTSSSTWAGGTAPGQQDNLLVKSGDVLRLVTSGTSCFNVYIENGGKLYTNLALPTTAYLRIYGDSLTVDAGGVFGDTTLSGANDGLSLEYFNDFTIKGNGLIRFGRIRPGQNVQDKTLVFDTDVTITYTGSSGTGGAGFYASNSGNDNITVTINSGKTVSLVNLSNWYTSSSGTTNGAANTTYNINGTLNMSGAGSNFSTIVATGKTCTVNVNGTLNVGNNFITMIDASAVPTINVNGSGTLSVGGTIDFINTSLNFAGTGTFNLNSGATMNIGHPDGLNSSTGPIRTSTRNFSTAANYAYVGTATQVTGADLPSTVARLTINNTLGVTLSNPLTVDTALALSTAGSKLTTDATNLLTLATTAGNGTVLGFVNGPMAKNFVSTAEYIFPVGKASKKLSCAVTPAVTDPLTFKAEYFNAGYGTYSPVDTPVASVNENDYFSINRTSGTGNAKVKLYYDTTHNIKNINNVRVLRWSGSNWDNVGGTGSGTPASGQVISGEISSFSPFTIGSGNPSADVKILIEGSYNTVADTMLSDTVTVALCNTTAPYAQVVSKKVLLSNEGHAFIDLSEVNLGGNYYIKVTHRNSIETWSNLPQTFSSAPVDYDFSTAADKAYGSNLVQKGTKYCIYSGDVNQDGQVSLDDLLAIDSDNQNFVTGYTTTDVNGDDQVTLDDLLITDANNQNFVSKQSPAGFVAKKVPMTEEGRKLLKKIEDYKKSLEQKKND